MDCERQCGHVLGDAVAQLEPTAGDDNTPGSPTTHSLPRQPTDHRCSQVCSLYFPVSRSLLKNEVAISRWFIFTHPGIKSLVRLIEAVYPPNTGKTLTTFYLALAWKQSNKLMLVQWRWLRKAWSEHLHYEICENSVWGLEMNYVFNKQHLNPTIYWLYRHSVIVLQK